MTESLSPIDAIWLLLATVLVIAMQAGFTCLESGLVRAKNSINVALKNLVDFCISGALFWAFGFAIMFGAVTGELVGESALFLSAPGAPSVLLFFLFQMALCGVATTIVSGAVAERMRFHAYVLITAITAAVIYPVFGLWAWGGGWLDRLGFVDVAGATVVHSVGGWVALAAVLLIGPRLGRFSGGGRAPDGHYPPIAVLGVFLLWIGWFGFNGGSIGTFDETVPLILLNTNVAAALGGGAAVFIGFLGTGRWNLFYLVNGVIAGLVSIAAACTVVTPAAAAAIGGLGGAIAVISGWWLERLRIDDPVGAIPAHLCAGIWGTLAVALFGDPALWGSGHDRFTQLGVQLVGVLAAGAYCFGVGYVLLRLAASWLPLRVTREVEKVGLNVGEHGASTDTLRLLTEMQEQRSKRDFSDPVNIEPETEAGQFAAQYNMVLAQMNAERAVREQAMRELHESKAIAEEASRTKTRFLANVSHELRTPLNAIVGFTELLQRETHGPLGNPRYLDYISDIARSGQHLARLIEELLDWARLDSGQQELKQDTVDVGEAIDEVLRLMHEEASQKQVRLERVDEIPSIALRADPRALRQILLSLVDNAIKFTPDGGSVEVRARIESGGDYAITVADTGCGIAEADLQRVMEPFAQVDGASRVKPDGVGLGLPLSRSLMDLHQGTLVIESEVGRGTAVTVGFPRSRTVQPEPSHGLGPAALQGTAMGD